MAQPAAILLLLASSAHGQTPLRPAIQLPARPPQPAQSVPAAKPAVVPTRTVSRPAAAPRTSTNVCRIQAGTFSRRANADKLALALKPLGEVRVKATTLDGKPVHLVTIVGLGARKNAELVLDRLKASGQDLGALSIAGCRT
jgi:cell division protein FtsN